VSRNLMCDDMENRTSTSDSLQRIPPGVRKSYDERMSKFHIDTVTETDEICF
ncbi:hypothetical protein CHS0354_009124, partial [Potamilus streckersoni]